MNNSNIGEVETGFFIYDQGVLTEVGSDQREEAADAIIGHSTVIELHSGDRLLATYLPTLGKIHLSVIGKEGLKYIVDPDGDLKKQGFEAWCANYRYVSIKEVVPAFPILKKAATAAIAKA